MIGNILQATNTIPPGEKEHHLKQAFKRGYVSSEEGISTTPANKLNILMENGPFEDVFPTWGTFFMIIILQHVFFLIKTIMTCGLLTSTVFNVHERFLT